jgi:hypothetical protein
MTNKLQSTLPERAASVQLYTRLVALLGRLTAPGESLSRSHRVRLQHVRCLLVVLPACLLLVTGPAWAEGKPALPGGVPNLFDPEVRAQYQPTLVGNLLANPDFPLVMLVNTTGIHPGAVLIALDARNGTDTWSLSTDPIVLIALFADPVTITDLYIDSGFLEEGTPTGSFRSVPDPREKLPDLLHALSEIPARTFL